MSGARGAKSRHQRRTSVRRPQDLTRWVTTVFGVGLVGLAVVSWATLSPWLSEPEEERAEIEERWAQLQERVAPKLPAGEPQGLVEAMESLEESSVTAVALEIDSTLDEPAERALERLVAWHRQGGGVGVGACVDRRLEAFNLMALGKIGLRAAEGPEDPRFRASLEVARHLRDRGSMIGSLVGTALFRLALERVEAEGWELPRVLVVERPRTEEVLATITKDVICWESSLDASSEIMKNPEWLASGRLERLSAALTFAPERERLYLRAELGRRLADAFASPTPAQMSQALSPPPREDDAPSLLVRGSMDLSAEVELLRAAVTSYDEQLLRVMERRSVGDR